MKIARRRVATLLLSLLPILSPASSLAWLPDTPENRETAADRYMKTVPADELLRDATERLAASLPPESRKEFTERMLQHLDTENFRRAMLSAMKKHFTASELEALAAFYGSAEGKSIVTKYNAYMSDLVPAARTEIQKALDKARPSN